MKILRAIGHFFARIGRWIKETAWVQPLLIVGAIFAVIFSIPSITSAVQAAIAGDTYSFYRGYQISLDGVTRGGGTSVVETLTGAIIKYETEGTVDQSIINTYGKKFYFSFVQTGCSGCETMKPAFETLRNNWGSNEPLTAKDGLPFRYTTVFCDEVLSYTEGLIDSNPFKTFLEGPYGEIFNIASQVGTEHPYYLNQGGDGSTYASQLAGIADGYDDFETPCTLLIDFTGQEEVISEVFFVVSPNANDEESSWTRAEVLMDAWNHTNQFSADYKK